MTNTNPLIKIIGNQLDDIQRVHEENILKVGCGTIDEKINDIFQTYEKRPIGYDYKFGAVSVYPLDPSIQNNEQSYQFKVFIHKFGDSRFVRLDVIATKKGCVETLTQIALKLQSDLQYAVEVDSLAKHGLKRYVEYTFENLNKSDVLTQKRTRDDIAAGVIQAYVLGGLSPDYIWDKIKILTTAKPQYAEAFNNAIKNNIFVPNENSPQETITEK